MNDTALRYRATILRAVFGSYANEGKVHDLHRLNQLCEHLDQCEQAQVALKARGYGRSGMTLLEIVRQVPINGLGRIRTWFASTPTQVPRQDHGLRHSPEEIERYLGESRY